MMEDLELCRKNFARRNEPPYYEVKSILKLWIGYGGERHYKIRWAGYGPEEDSWVKPEDLNCPDILDEFLQKEGLKNEVNKE